MTIEMSLVKYIGICILIVFFFVEKIVKSDSEDKKSFRIMVFIIWIFYLGQTFFENY